MVTNRERLITDGIDPTTMESHEIVTAYADPILDCGHPPTDHPHKDLTPGYGTDRATGRIMCWDCCNVATIADMRDAGTFGAYLTVREDLPADQRDAAHKVLTGFGKPYASVYQVTSWTGAVLARVTHMSQTRAGFGGWNSAFGGGGRWYFEAIDTNGKRWVCNSPGPGMYCRMRAAEPRRGDKIRYAVEHFAIEHRDGAGTLLQTDRHGYLATRHKDGTYSVTRGADVKSEPRIRTREIKAGW